jgi:DNA-3-methyladenine glycosylase II
MAKSLMSSPENILSADIVMKGLMAILSPPAIGRSPIFFSLVRAIISQQLSVAAASTIFKRLSAISEIAPATLLALDLDTFRECGISSQKAGYIKGIAEATLSGRLDSIGDLADEEAIKSLVKFKGVGRWTAEMILIFALGREDIWPCDDVGLLRAAKMLYGVDDVGGFITLGESFKPYRTHAACYLWASL